MLPSMREYFWQHVFLKSAAHWLAHKLVGYFNYHNLLLSFGMGDEVFVEMELPKFFDHLSPENLGL